MMTSLDRLIAETLAEYDPEAAWEIIHDEHRKDVAYWLKNKHTFQQLVDAYGSPDLSAFWDALVICITEDTPETWLEYNKIMPGVLRRLSVEEIGLILFPRVDSLSGEDFVKLCVMAGLTS